MSSTGTRVVPTLTEVLDEHRLGKPAAGLSAVAGQERRTGPEDLVPIRLDWGDAPEEAGAPAEGDVMTPWQVVRSRDVPVTADDVPFIDLSIDVAPVQAPDPHSQALQAFPTWTPDSRDSGAGLRPFTAAALAGEAGSGDADDVLGGLAPLPVLEPMPELVLDLAPLQPSVAEALADVVLHEEFVESVQPLTAFTGALPDLLSRPPLPASPTPATSTPASMSSALPEAPEPSRGEDVALRAGMDRAAPSALLDDGPATDAPAIEWPIEPMAPTSDGVSVQATVQSTVEETVEQTVEAPPPLQNIPPAVAPELQPVAATLAEPLGAPPLVAVSESAAPVHAGTSTPLRPIETPVAVPVAAVDPGTLAVRQAGEHVPGISEERLQAILQEALDRLLRDELPSALVETLIRLSPQLSESLIESLKPSLHLHVMEALSAESLGTPDGRRPA